MGRADQGELTKLPGIATVSSLVSLGVVREICTLPLFLAGVVFAVLLTIIVCIILIMNNILNIMLFYGLPFFINIPFLIYSVYLHTLNRLGLVYYRCLVVL